MKKIWKSKNFGTKFLNRRLGHNLKGMLFKKTPAKKSFYKTLQAGVFLYAFNKCLFFILKKQIYHYFSLSIMFIFWVCFKVGIKYVLFLLFNFLISKNK